MIKYDFKRILLPVGIRLSIAVIMTVIIGIIRGINSEGSDLSEWFVTFGIVFWVVIFWIANYLGTVAFKNELMDDGYEYMMTFPLSKKELIFNKMVPGLTVLGVLWFLFQVFNFVLLRDAVHLIKELGPNHAFLTDPIYFLLMVVFIYLSAFILCFFTPKKGQFGLNLFVIAWFPLMPKVFEMIYREFPWMKSTYILNSSVAVSALFILIVLIIAFIMTFRKFDTRGMVFHLRRFMFFGPLYLIILSIIFLLTQLEF